MRPVTADRPRSPLLTRRALAGGAACMALGLAPDAMTGDVALLRRAFEALHPGLLRYATAGETAARFDGLADALRRPTTLVDFYVTLSRFLAGIRCGHTYANFFNQTKPISAALFDAPDRLPFEFLWLDRQMVVTADPLGTGIVPGSEILAIEDRPAADILSGLLTVARADGSNDAKRRRLMSVQDTERYQSFDIFYPLLFGSRTRYRLLVQTPSGTRRAATVAATTAAARQTRPAAADADNPAGWMLARRGGAALLTMPTWAVYTMTWDWRGWLDAAMDRVVAARVPRLVVDLRANEGGDDCGHALIARLADRPISLGTMRRLVRYRRVPEALRAHLDTWDRSFDDWGDAAQPFDSRFYELRGGKAEPGAVQPKGPRFLGETIVLIGPQNSSATFTFAEIVQRERLATLVGEPTGGNRRGINGGAFYFLRLPQTGVEVDLPLIGTFPRVPQPDMGLLPDRLVRPTPADIARGRDTVLDAIL